MERKKENIFDFIEKCIAYITGISGDKGSVSEGDFLEDADRFRDKGYFLERMKEGVRFSPEVYYPEFRKSTYGYRFRRRLYKISSMAAVVVALLSTGYYFIGKSGERCGDDGIVPIHSKAYIKLEDGKIFYLDGLKTAVFSERENVKIVQDSGKIVYRTRRPYKHEIFNELNVPKGGEYVLELSDGTTVWMNADSKLRYPVNFSAEERVVYLTGEAFFSVVENKNKPFVVCASGGEYLFWARSSMCGIIRMKTVCKLLSFRVLWNMRRKTVKKYVCSPDIRRNIFSELLKPFSER